VNLGEAAMAAAITVSVAGVSYAAFGVPTVTRSAQSTADKATCRAVDQAIVAYAAAHDRAPRAIADIAPYVRGDISTYRISGGVAAGPGCAAV
jgi:hypothetical protein